MGTIDSEYRLNLDKLVKEKLLLQDKHLCVNEWVVDGNQLNIIAGKSSPGDEATDTAETCNHKQRE